MSILYVNRRSMKKLHTTLQKISEKKYIQLCNPPPVSRSRAITSENNGGFHNKGSNRMTFVLFCFVFISPD